MLDWFANHHKHEQETWDQAIAQQRARWEEEHRAADHALSRMHEATNRLLERLRKREERMAERQTILLNGQILKTGPITSEHLGASLYALLTIFPDARSRWTDIATIVAALWQVGKENGELSGVVQSLASASDEDLRAMADGLDFVRPDEKADSE